jgi:uracil-DNA glycosylase family 4
MRHKLLQQRVQQLEHTIFNCNQCQELSELRLSRAHNCPVLGFDFNHYLNAKVCSVCEAPGIYKPHKGELFIDRVEDFHKIYDDRIQNVALIGQRLISIFSQAGLTWDDVQHFNVVCCSPPDYRKPKIDEIANCIHFLYERMKLMQKMKVIVAFGAVAKSAVVKANFGVPIIKTNHPSYLYSYMSEADREVEINRVVDLITSALQ